MAHAGLDPDKLVDLLMRKYVILRQEVILHIGLYKSHVRNFQFMAGAILAIAAFLLVHPEYLPNMRNWWLWWAFLTLLPLVANYLALDVIEPQYALLLLAERLATLEEEVNRIACRRLLIWESEGSRQFYYGLRPLPGIVNPEWGLGVIGILMLLSTAIIIPLGGYWILYVSGAVPQRRLVYAAFLAGAALSLFSTGFTIYAGHNVLLRLRGRPRILFRKLMSEKLGDPKVLREG